MPRRPASRRPASHRPGLLAPGLALLLALGGAPGLAQEGAGRAPAQPLPPAFADVPPLAAMAGQGWRFLPLGPAHGLEGLIALRGAGERLPIYVTPDRQAIVYGGMFGADGLSVTEQQLKALRAGGVDITQPCPGIADVGERFHCLVEQMAAIELAVAPESAPLVMLALPLDCVRPATQGPAAPGSCAAYLDALEPAILAGRLALRLIPVAPTETARDLALAMLGAPDEIAAWRRWRSAGTMPPPASPEAARVLGPGLVRETERLLAWGVDEFPFTLWRDAEGVVQLIKGVPEDPATALLATLPPGADAPPGAEAPPTPVPSPSPSGAPR